MATSFDDVIKCIGEFGRYQRRVYALLCVVALYVGLTNLSTVFNTYIQKHRCKISGWDGDTYEIQDANHSMFINATIPLKYDNNSNSVSAMSQCSMYSDNGTLVECTEWVYDASVIRSSAVSQFDLVCRRKMWRAHVRMTFMIGNLVGGLLFGPLSDKIGRKRSLMIALFIMCMGSSLMAASPNVYVFVVFNFLSGLGVNASYLVVYGLGIEFVGTSKRFHANQGFLYNYALGIMIISFFAFLLRDWKHIQLIVALPGVFFISFFWLIPESPRWLLNKNHKPKAVKIMTRMAKVNKVTMETELLENMYVENVNTTKDEKIWHLFAHRRVTAITVIVMFNWVVCSLIYYGLSLNAGNLSGSIYLNLCLSGLVELVAYLFCHILLNRIGRKLMFIASIMTSGVACLLTIFTVLYISDARQWITVALAMVGKMGATSAFSIVYIHTVELFPTGIRTTMLGATSMVARFGSIIAPYVVDLSLMMKGDMGRAMPLVTFGGVAVASGFLSLYLPETLNKPLPETFEDCRNLFRKENDRRNHVTIEMENAPLDDKLVV